MAEFKKYMHIERLGTDEDEGILVGDCYVFPKIDGANGSVWMDVNKDIKCGSRKRELSETVTNRGFTEWVKKNEDKFRKLFTEYPQAARVYGEWLVPHVIKHYEKSKYNNFYVFDVKDTNGLYIGYDLYNPWLEDCDIDYVPVIRKVTDPEIDDLKEAAVNDKTFLIEKNDTRKGEGIVIKNYTFLNRFKRVCWAKLITADVLKQQTKKNNEAGDNKEKKPERSKGNVEEKIVEDFAPDHFIDKMIAILDSGDDKLKRQEIKHAIYVEFLKEEAKDFLQAFENVAIHPRSIKRKLYEKIEKRLALQEEPQDRDKLSEDSTDVKELYLTTFEIKELGIDTDESKGTVCSQKDKEPEHYAQKNIQIRT